MRDQAERPEKNNRPRLLAIARKKQKRNHNGCENDDRVALGSGNMKEDTLIWSQRNKRSQRRLTQVDAKGSERSKRDHEIEGGLNQAGHCSGPERFDCLEAFSVGLNHLLELKRFKLNLLHLVEEEVTAEHLLLNRQNNIRRNTG